MKRRNEVWATIRAIGCVALLFALVALLAAVGMWTTTLPY